MCSISFPGWSWSLFLYMNLRQLHPPTLRRELHSCQLPYQTVTAGPCISVSFFFPWLQYENLSYPFKRPLSRLLVLPTRWYPSTPTCLLASRVQTPWSAPTSFLSGTAAVFLFSLNMSLSNLPLEILRQIIEEYVASTIHQSDLKNLQLVNSNYFLGYPVDYEKSD